MATITSSMEVLGGRLLREIAAEEGSLEDILTSLRQTALPAPSKTGLPALDALTSQYSPNNKLSISGRGLPLLHHLLTTLLSPQPHKKTTIALLDLTSRFSPSHLAPSLPRTELDHIHVFHPTPSNLKATLENVEQYMLYGEHGSKCREWVGTIVLGGTGGDVDVDLGWKGWLRVERMEVGVFGERVGVEEVWGERGMKQRQEVVDKTGWRAGYEGGSYSWN